MFLPACCQAQAPPAFTIVTVAGDGIAGILGDGGPATEARLNHPVGVFADNAGNLYIADQLNGRIRKVAADGTITTVAGSSTFAYSGDGGAATSAALYNPCGVVVDSAGNILIADTHNNVIRKVSPAGTITTVAGTGTAGYSGDGGAATSATLNVPIGLALDAAGNLYIADSFNSVIRKVAPDGTIATVAGKGLAGYTGDGDAATGATLSHPQGVAVDAAGNLFIADTFNHRIRQVVADGTITTVAGSRSRGYAGDGGPALQAALNYPKSVAVDPSGNLYIADSSNSRVRVVTPDGTIGTVAGDRWHGYYGDGGPASSAVLRFPSGMALDAAGRLYVADTQNSRIRVLVPLPAGGSPAAPLSARACGLPGAGADAAGC